jgi:hypothetical protein
MTKKQNVLSGQGDLFEWVKEAARLTGQAQHPHAGALDIRKAFKAALTEDIKHARGECGRELSRAQVAAKMTDLIGEEITDSMMNNWTATSHPHNIPADYLPAFVLATGGQRRTFELLSRSSGLFALPGPEALRAEIQRLDEEEHRIKNEKMKRKFYLREIENGGSK